jgi:hypothetical protein
VERVDLNAGNGRRLILERVSGRDVDPVWSFRATLAVHEGTTTTIVYEHGRRLAAYFRELADAWQGFDGVKSFASLEGQLTIDASHDGLGIVWCDVRLREPPPPRGTSARAWAPKPVPSSTSRPARSTHSSGDR